MPRTLRDELSDAERVAVADGAAAVGRLLASSRAPDFADYLAAARGFAVIRRLADTCRARAAAFRYFIGEFGYDGLAQATVSRLLLIARHEQAVLSWRDALSEADRERWNSPVELVNRCPALREAIANGRWTRDRTDAGRTARRKLQEQRAARMRFAYGCLGARARS